MDPENKVSPSLLAAKIASSWISPGFGFFAATGLEFLAMGAMDTSQFIIRITQSIVFCFFVWVVPAWICLGIYRWYGPIALLPTGIWLSVILTPIWIVDLFA